MCYISSIIKLVIEFIHSISFNLRRECSVLWGLYQIKPSIAENDTSNLQSWFLIFRDIVRMTAQFVARNGRQFLTSLMNREQRNCQFDFLRPQHSLFQYFTKLLEQYTKVFSHFFVPVINYTNLNLNFIVGKFSSQTFFFVIFFLKKI